MRYQIECPYCQSKQGFTPESMDVVSGRSIVLCDVDIGGCDLPFVVLWRVTLEASAHAIAGIGG